MILQQPNAAPQEIPTTPDRGATPSSSPELAEDRSSVPTLTSFECVVISALANGLQSKEIAVVLGRSKATVEGYVRVLFIKFNVRSRAQLVAAAYDSGVLPSRGK